MTYRSIRRSRAPMRAAALALALWGCAATTPPPRFSPVSPADPTAPEAATPPPSPSLGAEGELSAPEPPPPPAPATGHEGHSMHGVPSSGGEAPAGREAPSPAAEPRTTYTCPMHPEVEARAPGSCPLCAMPLVKRPVEKKEPAR
jgi:hypothetical protein